MTKDMPWKFSSVRVLVVDEGSLVSVGIFKSVLNLLCEHSQLSKLIILGKLKYCWNPNCLVQIIVVSTFFIPFHCFNIHILQAGSHFSDPTLKPLWVQSDQSLWAWVALCFGQDISKLGCEWNRVVRSYCNYLNGDY